MPICDLCDGDLEDTRGKTIHPRDSQGRPLQNIQAINLMVCDFCYGELGKPDSPARKRFEDRFDL